MVEQLQGRLFTAQPHLGACATLRICIFLGMLLGLVAWPTPAAAQDGIVQEAELTACIGPDGYAGTEDAKNQLLATVKRDAISTFYGEHIAATTLVQDFVITRDEVRAAVQGLVRIAPNPEFYSGVGLGEICVRAKAYVTKSDLELFTLQPVRAERVCDNGDGTAAERRQVIQDLVRSNALLAFDGRLATIDLARRLTLLHEARYVNAGFQSDTGAYCAGVTGMVMPFEVYALLGVAPPPPKPTPTSGPALVSPLRILSVAPSGSLPVGAVLTVRGSSPPTTQIEVLASGAQLGVTMSAADGAWQVEIPFNTAGTYRLTTRMYLADGTIRPGSRDVLIQVVAPTATRMLTITLTLTATSCAGGSVRVSGGCATYTPTPIPSFAAKETLPASTSTPHPQSTPAIAVPPNQPVSANSIPSPILYWRQRSGNSDWAITPVNNRYYLCTTGENTIIWKWDGVLGEHMGFEVGVSKMGDPSATRLGIHDARITAGITPDSDGLYRLNLDLKNQFYGDYYLTVAVVNLEPYSIIKESVKYETIIKCQR